MWSFWNVNSYTFAKRDVIIFRHVCNCVPESSNRRKFMEFGAFYQFFCFGLAYHAAHLLLTLVIRKNTPGLYTGLFLVTPYMTYYFTVFIKLHSAA
ncbi:HXXEE domain-containing protein [Paenibacillus sambharensis]|uniref:HXXEE domain-containing protein n=1 Tax=Paenibacillus sambharensis TaxID=1803190 RepID=UPI003CCC6056